MVLKSLRMAGMLILQLLRVLSRYLCRAWVKNKKDFCKKNHPTVKMRAHCLAHCTAAGQPVGLVNKGKVKIEPPKIIHKNGTTWIFGVGIGLFPTDCFKSSNTLTLKCYWLLTSHPKLLLRPIYCQLWDTDFRVQYTCCQKSYKILHLQGIDTMYQSLLWQQLSWKTFQQSSRRMSTGKLCKNHWSQCPLVARRWTKNKVSKEGPMDNFY